MNAFNVKNIVFSSSATVYGSPAEIPITENCPKERLLTLMVRLNL